MYISLVSWFKELMRFFIETLNTAMVPEGWEMDHVTGTNENGKHLVTYWAENTDTYIPSLLYFPSKDSRIMNSPPVLR